MPLSTALVVLGALVMFAVAVGFALSTRDGRRRSGGDLRMRPDDLGAALAPAATLVQFSTEMCARCPRVRRLLTEIADSHPGVAHVEIDLTNRNDLASRYHVMQTPTTFLVAPSGAVLSRWGGVPDPRAIDDALTLIPDSQPQEHP